MRQGCVHVCVMLSAAVSRAAFTSSINVAALSGMFLQVEKDGAGLQGWKTLKRFPRRLPGFHYQGSCQGKRWPGQRIRQNCSFLELRNSHPLGVWLGHLPLPAGPFEGISASRMPELLERHKNLGDSEKLSSTRCKPLLKALHLRRENKTPGPQSSC